MKQLVPFVLVIVLGACSHFSYQEPAGEHTATLVFSSNNVAVQPVVCVPGKGFEPTEFAVAQKPFQSEFFTELNRTLKKTEKVEVRVEAGEPLRVGFIMNRPRSDGPRSQCKVAARFTPMPGETFRVRFTLEGEFCGLSLSDDAGQPLADAVITPYECP